jgi:hypothetical protein
MCAWFEPGSGVPAVVHSFGKRVFTLCSAHRGGIQVPDGRRSVPTGTEPGTLQTRLLEAYAVDLVPEEAVRWLFQQPPTPHRPGMPTISVVPAGEERRRV